MKKNNKKKISAMLHMYIKYIKYDTMYIIYFFVPFIHGYYHTFNTIYYSLILYYDKYTFLKAHLEM